MKYSSNYQSFILNFFGEFDKFMINHEKKKLRFIDHYPSLVSFLPYRGKLKSRLSFMLIFILGFFPLKKILKENKPDFLIIHLITSLPLILLLFFKFDTKFILRISGHPKMNFLRKFLWEIAFKKVIFIGPVYGNEKHKLLKNCNLYICSSLYEGFPNAVVDALNYNMPVISSKNHGGINEIILNNRGGELYDVGNQNQLAKKIFHISRNYNSSIKKTFIAKKFLNRFTKSNIKKYENLFDKV